MSDYIRWIRGKVGHDPIILVASLGIVLDSEGRILLQRTSDKEDMSWGLPGGMMELGEGVEDTLMREVKEETGLEITLDYLQGIYSKLPLTKYKNGDVTQVICLAFVCRMSGGSLKSDDPESVELKFVDPESAKELLGKNCFIAEDYINRVKAIIK